MNGEEGLTDKRGRHKTDEEVDELEKLRRENLCLKRQLEEKDVVVELLKKFVNSKRMLALKNNGVNLNIWQSDISMKKNIGILTGCVSR